MDLNFNKLLTIVIFFLFFVTNLFSISLKSNSGDWSRLQFVTSPPRNYEEATARQYPTTADVEINFGDFKEGETIGPDGGQIYKWKEGTYKWKFKNGGELVFWNKKSWAFNKDNNYFLATSDLNPNKSSNFKLTYADGSILSQVYNEKFKINFYYFEDEKRNLYTQYFPKDLFASRSKTVGNFRFYFELEHEAWIDSFTEGKAMQRFLEYINQVGYTSSRDIPVVFFKDTKSIRNFINDQMANCSGGRGGIFGLSFCNESSLFGYIGSTDKEKLYSKSITHTHMMYHEWGHHLQQLECHKIRSINKFPNPVFSAWFNEGMAEYLGYIGSSKKRGSDRILFFETFIRGNKIPNLKSDDPYLVGGQLFRSLAEKYGESSVLELWRGICRGEREDNVIKSLTNLSPQEFMISIYSDMVKIKSEGEVNDFMDKTLKEWSIDVEILPFSSPASKLPNLMNTSVKPNIKEAFLLDIDLVRGKLEGQFTTERNEKVDLFLSGTYTILGSNYKATVFSDQTVVFQSLGHKITEWSNGKVNWDLPNGEKFSF